MSETRQGGPTDRGGGWEWDAMKSNESSLGVNEEAVKWKHKMMVVVTC